MEPQTAPPASPTPTPPLPDSQLTPPPPKNKKKKLVIVTMLIVLVAAMILAAILNQKDNGGSGPGSKVDKSSEFAKQYLRDCEDKNITFSESPLAIENMGYLEPMGKMYDGHVTPTDHVYLTPKDPKAADNTTDVVMPADGTVISVGAMPAQYIGDKKNKEVAPQDHRLIVAHNCRFVSIFIHVHELSGPLKAAVGTMPPNTNKDISIKLKAGETLGKIGGNPVDWSLMDAAQELSGFIHPNLYASESWKIHVIDPITVYEGSLKQDLIAKSLRSSEPYGGKIDYDEKGALIGNWFREGTNGYKGSNPSRYWDGHLAIVPHHFDPSSTIVSVGNWQGSAEQFVVKDNQLPPNEITSGSGVVKYELLEINALTPEGQAWDGVSLVKGLRLNQEAPLKGTIIIEVLPDEKLRAEFFPGKAADKLKGFTPSALIFQR